MRLFLSFLLALLLTACAGPQLRGTGDLGLIIERASGHVTLVNTSSRQPYARIAGLGDLSHASAVYSRDGRYAFIFGRDGGLTKIDLLEFMVKMKNENAKKAKEASLKKKTPDSNDKNGDEESKVIM